jgi:SAM-dependent methyltransferase
VPVDLPDEERAAYLRTAERPAPLLDLIGMMAGHTVIAAARLGVFDALAVKPLGAAELATALPADPTGLRLLLDALVAIGYVDVDNGRYANRPAAERWLRTDSPGGFTTVLELWGAAVAHLWGDLDTSIRTGTPTADFYSWLAERPARQQRFQEVQRGLAGWLADELVELADLPDPPTTARRLVDVGGGHAWFSAAFCQRHPDLTAVVLDLPAALPSAARTIAETGLTDRIALREADLNVSAPIPGCDVVLLFNVLHGFAPERAQGLIAEAVAALRPGGVVLVLENDPEPTPERIGGAADEAFRRLFAINVWHTQSGQVHPVDTLAGWLVAAGCRPPHIRPLRRSPGHVLLMASREEVV